MVAPTWLMVWTEWLVADCISEICAAISSVALEVCVARAFASDATTANPRPASPALAASIVASSACGDGHNASPNKRVPYFRRSPTWRNQRRVKSRNDRGGLRPVVTLRSSIRPRLSTEVSLKIARLFTVALSLMLWIRLSDDNCSPSVPVAKVMAAASPSPRSDCPGARRIDGALARPPRTTM